MTAIELRFGSGSGSGFGLGFGFGFRERAGFEPATRDVKRRQPGTREIDRASIASIAPRSIARALASATTALRCAPTTLVRRTVIDSRTARHTVAEILS